MAETMPEAAPQDQRQTFALVDARTGTADAASGGGCGCGGHGHGGRHRVEEDPSTAEQAEDGRARGCGCGGHGHRHGRHRHGAPTGAAPAGADELVIHSIPALVRHAALFAAVDAIPVGENLTIVAPHQPDRLFARLQQSEAHYRVETLDAGPVDWRYRITRIS
ncbi:DUF2249 domain-containing protein [Actinomyces sp. B33]|uniref:DUF2249 domain-containing protein n=1 Tax=Actinomyces sp. B33 TaxID=2942131 RepID=UPI0023418DA4|nr:DUF2249 domain-containing protein [Actinomyces sp. B33]MDC4232452.1 DUF2249 domain-containing protein [Actinomyces sp. B33]